MMMLQRTMLVAALVATTTTAFTPAPVFTHSNTASSPDANANTVALAADGTGGWGMANSRDMVPEEFVRGDRNAFEGYNLRERGEFMRQVKQDKEDLIKDEMDELLGVAQIAGINVKDPKERLNKFEFEEDDDDDLDLTVQWEAADPFERKGNDDSITRMDEDTGAPGTW